MAPTNEQLATVLHRAKDVRYGLVGLGPPPPESAAAHDAEQARRTLGNARAGIRAYFLADVWLLTASHYLGSMGVLFGAGEVLMSPLPLARAVQEHSARTTYLLSPAHASKERAALAAIEEAFAAQEMAKAVKRLWGGDDPRYKSFREKVGTARADLKALSGDEPTDSPDKWQVLGQRLLRPTEVVEHLGELDAASRTHVGLYDFGSAFTHPGLGLLLFLALDEDGRPAGLDASQDAISAIAQNALAFFYPAMEHFVRYAGWSYPDLDAFADELESTFPGFFTTEVDPPAS